MEMVESSKESKLKMSTLRLKVKLRQSSDVDEAQSYW